MPAGTSTSSAPVADDQAAAVADLARLSRRRVPSPPQTSQATWRTTCPNGVRVTACSTPVAAAALARLDRRAGLGAVAVAVLAAVDGLVGDLDLGAAVGLREVDLDGHGDVAALARAGARAAAERAAERRRRRTRRTGR